MYSGITKLYYRKTVGHVFTKPVQIEGTTKKKNFPTKLFSSQFTFLPLGDAIVCSEKMAAPGDKSFCVLEYHTVSLWLLCNVHFVQSKQRTDLQTRPFLRGINNLLKLGVCASRKHSCWRVCSKNLNIVSMCAVSPLVHTSNISSCKKQTFFNFPVVANNSIKVGSFGFLVINVCNHGEHYETPCIYYILLYSILNLNNFYNFFKHIM